jgi:prepilin-type N-terminal cleavage/methylation domain-containing protein
VPRLRGHGFRESERGFTLPEVLIVIVLMGILFAIASSTWFGVIESRRVDSAANQLASDLRLAHTRATNQLSDWQVVMYLGRGDEGQGMEDYKLVRVSDGFTVNRFLPENSVILSSEINAVGGSRTLRLRSNGAAEAEGLFTDADIDGQIRITVSVDGDPSRSLTVVPATSRIKVA